MAKEFSKRFYKSKAWLMTREYIFKRDGGLCQDCLKKGNIKDGEEVHHIIFLDSNNINDPEVTLGEKNLVLLCKECHHKRHSFKKNTREGLQFDEKGQLIEK